MDDEPPRVWSELTPKARREHTCCECKGTIAKGETYHLFKGCWDGDWATFKTCADCEQIRDEVNSVMDRYDPPVAFTQLYEHVFEAEADYPAWMIRFMETRKKRGAPESPNGWMERRYREFLEEQAKEGVQG